MHVRAVIAFLFVLITPSLVAAQTDRPSPNVEGVIGHAAFLDEAPIDHLIFGGAFRYPLSPRVSVGPELVYMIGPGHDRDLFVTGDIWFDFNPRLRGVPARFSPYLVAGVGLMRHSDESLRDFVAHEWAFTGGAGLRIALNDRWYLAPEARLGWEPHVRLSASVGYVFGR